LEIFFTIDLELVLPDKTLSVKEGGISPLGEERDASVFQQVVEFAGNIK
jgi:excinuclease ABC subunit A